MEFVTEYIAQVYNSLDDLVFSVLVVLIIVFVCDFIREILLYEGRLNFDLDYRYAVAELIGTVEATVICFEINFIIYQISGVLLYAVASFIWYFWQSKRAPEYQYEANVLNLFVNHVKAQRNRVMGDNEDDDLKMSLYQRFDFFGLMICAELLGVYLAFHIILHGELKHASYWTMWRETNFHFTRYNSVNKWESSMKSPVAAGICECFFSFAQYLWPVYLGFRKLDGNTIILMSSLGRAIFAGIGAGYSGGFYNPLIACELESHTEGSSSFTILMVYLVGPFIGTVLALIIEEAS